METKSKSGRGLIILVILLLVAILIALVVLVITLTRQTGDEYAASVPENQRARVEYATEGVTVVDEDALQRAVDEIMNAPDDGVALKYQNDAFSDDGQNFDCFIANSEMNTLDAFFTICADNQMTDELYVSGLLRPGQAFEKIKLTRALEPGNHTVYVGISLVEEQDGEQVIDRQMVYTMEFHVGS